jgi:hypothetical protein
MGWHVRYTDRSLKHELLSPEFATRDEAFEAAWTLAQEKNDISAIEGPDEELVSMEEISAWFDRRASRKGVIGAIRESKKPKKDAAARAVIAKGAEARGKAKTAVDEALAGSPATRGEKATRKRKLTTLPNELKPPEGRRPPKGRR